MKLNIDGAMNAYYVQMLCMVFFPGTKFSDNCEVTENDPVLDLKVVRDESGIRATAQMSLGDLHSDAERYYCYRSDMTHDRIDKIAVGDAVISAGSELINYRPVWGMLTGVRPSKVATEMLRSGMSKTRTKKTLTNEYFVIPKKAALATDVALNEMKIIGTPDIRDCSMYISIPFCPTRCAYCSFVSYTSKKLLALIPEYLERLMKDVKKTLRNIGEMGLNLKTIYIGGGTPTILDERQLEYLLSGISETIDTSKLEEFTLEAGRPDTITLDKFLIANKHGVTRVSVNPQILCDEVLSGIGRSHNTEEFFRAYEMARNSGIDTINTDLIAGLPGDSFKTFAASFDKILELRPENITVHTFCVKKASDLLRENSNIYSIRGGDTGKCVDYSQIKSTYAGYRPYYMYRQKNTVGNYENVGMALEGKEGLYNIYMMEEVHTIFAEGAGAVTKLVDVERINQYNRSDLKIKRIFNEKYPYEYLKNDKTDEKWAEVRAFYSELGIL